MLSSLYHIHGVDITLNFLFLINSSLETLNIFAAMAALDHKEESSDSSHRCAYQVFLSFRGEDTRKNFTDHLYTALVRAGIHTFRDDDEIRRGEEIELEIKKAIQESRMSVVVLSKDYASSRWCLDELVMIMERRRTSGHGVLPVFYDVDPTQVGTQTGKYGESFAGHEKRFKEDMERVGRWRSALKDVADLRGMVLLDRCEGKFVQNIVKEIGHILKHRLLSVAPYLVGIDYRISDIDKWLQDGSDEIGIALIYGVGGIGKTTITKFVYNQNFDSFEGWSFLADVRETSAQPNGMLRLQRQLIADLHKAKVDKINDVDEGTYRIKDALRFRKVLLILDDVDHLDQVNAIIGMRQWFSRGSKIIITTRYENLIKTNEVYRMFKINVLDETESLQLFSWHAFGGEPPSEGYEGLSESAVRLCGGIPLALQVLGSSLYGKSPDVWESALQKFKAIPDSKIQKILRVSFDSLEDDHDKRLFLDVACFFTGKDRDYLVTVLDGCGFYTIAGIDNLIDRYLITINEDNKLMMHQLLRDMGREIIRQESPGDPGKRSRVWRQKDALTVLTENRGTETIRGLNLSLQKDYSTLLSSQRFHYNDSDAGKLRSLSQGYGLKQDSPSWSSVKSWLANSSAVENLKTQAFNKMNNLKLLQLNYVTIDGDYGHYPESLVWLFWRGFTLKFVPNNLFLDNLVVLDMRNSNLTSIWKGKKKLPKLKILNLSHSYSLVKTPDFTGLPFLERLKLKDCVKLVEIDESIGNLQKLVLLDLKDCKTLKKLPENISLLDSLKKLILSGCSKLDQLPRDLGKLESLNVVRVDRTGINDFHAKRASWFSSFRSRLLPRKNPVSIESSLAFLPCSLVDLRLANCSLTDFSIPNDLRCIQSLENLDLRGNLFSILPETIKNLTTLQYLVLNGCTNLRSLPHLPSSLEELSAEGCSSLERLANLPNLHKVLQTQLFGCEQLVEVEDLFKLEPLVNIDKEMGNDLGLPDLLLLGRIEMTIFNAIANREKMSPPQVLHECGIHSSFLPGNNIPGCFSENNIGSFISLKVSPLFSHEVCGLNLCVLYARDDQAFFLRAGGHYAKVCNKTKGINWAYSPTFYGIPEAGEGMLWFSLWKFGDQLEVGDEVVVSVRMPHGFHVKECRMRIVYEQSNKQEIIERSSGKDKNVADRDLWPYQEGEGVYFLHHHPYTTPEEIFKTD